VFQSFDFSGGIWDTHSYTISGGIIPGNAQFIQASIVLNNSNDQVLANGKLVSFYVNTTGFSSGQVFPLSLSIAQAGVSSGFVLYGGQALPPVLTDGSISLYQSTVVGRYVFYNQSHYNGNATAPTSADDGAIDTSKQALLPGATATFSNYTSYSRGINGIMIDVNGLANPSTLSASDFTFKVGTSSDPSTWATAPAPTSITVRTGAGVGGSYRVTLIWANNAIQDKWLQVTLKSANTGLATNDVFYFGNEIGESGNDPANTFVDGTDITAARDNFNNFLNIEPVTYPYDYNKDGYVNGTDMVIARDNATNFLTSLPLLTAPAGGLAASRQFRQDNRAGRLQHH
jgi:hypothetical protein